MPPLTKFQGVEYAGPDMTELPPPPDIELGAIDELPATSRIAQRQLVLALVVERRVILVGERAIAQLETSAERRQPADAQAVTLRAHTVFEQIT